MYRYQAISMYRKRYITIVYIYIKTLLWGSTLPDMTVTLHYICP